MSSFLQKQEWEDLTGLRQRLLIASTQKTTAIEARRLGHDELLSIDGWMRVCRQRVTTRVEILHSAEGNSTMGQLTLGLDPDDYLWPGRGHVALQPELPYCSSIKAKLVRAAVHMRAEASEAQCSAMKVADAKPLRCAIQGPAGNGSSFHALNRER
jgi:hypothetical protein